jgi:bifunctional DNA-binding transcriptional regulator/antitoxin component of YhaV-PrlF toxin-antitoxin module
MNKKEDIGETTTLTPATTKSTSMRATVPMSIIKQFNLKAGDKLSWKLKIEDGELVVIVRPIKE